MLTNLPPEEWPRILQVDFTLQSNEGQRVKSFRCGKTRGPEGDESVVHSVRAEIVGGVLSFFIYYALMGEERERFWQVIGGHPHHVVFDSREDLR
jgi:hypothetical protein